MIAAWQTFSALILEEQHLHAGQLQPRSFTTQLLWITQSRISMLREPKPASSHHSLNHTFQGRFIHLWRPRLIFVGRKSISSTPPTSSPLDEAKTFASWILQQIQFSPHQCLGEPSSNISGKHAGQHIPTADAKRAARLLCSKPFDAPITKNL